MSDSPLSADETIIWTAIKTFSGDVLAAVGRDIEAATDLSVADFSILTRLEDLGHGRLAQADLLASLAWEKSRLSHHITRMESRQFVERIRLEPRTVTISMLPLGREHIAVARPIHAEAVRRRILRHIDKTEARTLLAIVERISKSVR